MSPLVPGWHLHPHRRHTLAYWDGERWSEDTVPAPGAAGGHDKPRVDGFVLLAAGVGVGVLAAVFADSADNPLILTIGTILAMALIAVGAVAAGVRLGIRHADYERYTEQTAANLRARSR